MSTAAGHWDDVFETRADDEVSWYQIDPAISLRLLTRWASPTTASMIDVGAGTSTLVDDLLELGWHDVTVLDISEAAVSKVRDRLGPRAEAVKFVVTDVRSWQPDRTYDAWHDRAVFHFLTEEADRDHYVAIATDALEPGGTIVLATFAANGPTECSGLPTCRYSPEELIAIFDGAFLLEQVEREEHPTPFGTIQPFSWVVLRRR
ncbi:MAG TPA: class I SAM-dependent methyltransferase [Acidimicrobiales bacterium]